MKNIYASLLLFFISFMFGQADPKPSNLKFDFAFRANLNRSLQYGETSLARGFKNDYGFGMSLDIVRFKNFKAGLGVDFQYYNVTDIQKIGNFDRSIYAATIINIQYEFAISKLFLINPVIGFGDVGLYNRGKQQRSFGYASGNDLRVGLLADYKLDRTVSAFIGVHYITSEFDINTATEFLSFYNRANQFQVSLGIKLN